MSMGDKKVIGDYRPISLLPNNKKKTKLFLKLYGTAYRTILKELTTYDNTTKAP